MKPPEICQRLAHDNRTCNNIGGDPANCAPECTMAPCRVDGDHPGTDHLDPRSPHYDGPILANDRDGEAFRVILAALPDTLETRVAVHHLVGALREAQDQRAHAWVDRDRGIREAMRRSQSCEAHGEQIRELGERLHAAHSGEERTNQARLALLGFLLAVDDAVKAYRAGAHAELTLDTLVTALEGSSRKAHAAHTWAWSR